MNLSPTEHEPDQNQLQFHHELQIGGLHSSIGGISHDKDEGSFDHNLDYK